MNDTNVAQIRFGGSFWLPMARMFAPKTIGIDMRNENLIACFSSRPSR